MTSAGDLSHRVAFDSRQDVDDGFGNTKADWVERFIVHAKVQPKFGGEAVIAARLTGQQPVTIVVRQSSKTIQIQPEWRARDAREGTEYAIRSIVDPDASGAYLELLCQTGVAA